MHSIKSEIFSIKLWRKLTKFYPMTIISSYHENEIQFFRNHIHCSRILKLISRNKWFNPPDTSCNQFGSHILHIHYHNLVTTLVSYRKTSPGPGDKLRMGSVAIVNFLRALCVKGRSRLSFYFILDLKTKSPPPPSIVFSTNCILYIISL